MEATDQALWESGTLRVLMTIDYLKISPVTTTSLTDKAVSHTTEPGYSRGQSIIPVPPQTHDNVNFAQIRLRRMAKTSSGPSVDAMSNWPLAKNNVPRTNYQS